MDSKRLDAAFAAWALAIRRHITCHGTSYDDSDLARLAAEYGKSITNEADLREVAKVFDFEELERLLSDPPVPPTEE